MPRIKASQMGGNHTVTGSWCSGCGLYRQTAGKHRADCTRGHHGHQHAEPCTDRCETC